MASELLAEYYVAAVAVRVAHARRASHASSVGCSVHRTGGSPDRKPFERRLFVCLFAYCGGMLCYSVCLYSCLSQCIRMAALDLLIQLYSHSLLETLSTRELVGASLLVKRYSECNSSYELI